MMKLSNQQIKEILEHYDIGEFKKKNLVYNAWNTSYKVTTNEGDYLVKYLKSFFSLCFKQIANKHYSYYSQKSYNYSRY